MSSSGPGFPAHRAPSSPGRSSVDPTRLQFTYARSYLDHDGRDQPVLAGAPAAPGSAGTSRWAQRRGLPEGCNAGLLGRAGHRQPTGYQRSELSLETYMLESGSNRLGALDFQADSAVTSPGWTRPTCRAVRRAEKVLPVSRSTRPSASARQRHGHRWCASECADQRRRQASSTSPSCPCRATCIPSSRPKPSASSSRDDAASMVPQARRRHLDGPRCAAHRALRSRSRAGGADTSSRV